MGRFQLGLVALSLTHEASHSVPGGRSGCV